MSFWQTGFWADGFWSAGFWGDALPVAPVRLRAQLRSRICPRAELASRLG